MVGQRGRGLAPVSSPIRIMNTGISGSVTTTITAEVTIGERDDQQRERRDGDRQQQGGQVPGEIRAQALDPAGEDRRDLVAARVQLARRQLGGRLEHLAPQLRRPPVDADRCAKRACDQVDAVRTATAAASTASSVPHAPSVRASGSVITPASTVPIISADTMTVAGGDQATAPP